MARTDEKKENKRKRQNDEGDALGEAKKTKKSKKSSPAEEVAIAENGIVESKKERKERKKDKKRNESEASEDVAAADTAVETKASKKPKKSKKSRDQDEAAPEAATAESKSNTGDTSLQQDFIRFGDEPMPDATNGAASKDKKKSKKDKKDKKSKSAKEEQQEPVVEESNTTEPVKENGAAPETLDDTVEGATSKKEKKKSKKDKSSKAKESDPKEQPVVETNGTEAASEEDPKAETDDTTAAKKGRFIVFVGNLPFTATKEQVEAHFEKIEPAAVRLQTDKFTKKPKGTAFVEFDRFERMETCLKKYHHSIFAEGNKKKEGRKINVELSAGGGGNSENRKSKILAKNDKLHDERQRDREKRAEVEAKQQERKEKKDKKDARQKGAKKDEPAKGTEAPAEENVGIHPSRLAMMSKPVPAWKQRHEQY
ncbi:hypothetical protein BDV95DRAFT_663841 [Massariosphaeria phaeospora]|uniref:RRM domain-containing protein n=1 Tax=Massariosphaeria phaeospora TaxID=100035 RepID=A0A7C8IDM9_9PLEO|nr:hypothetical protein BDV95DRAFT_663841 [Massariosphaeria phaeospora]